jgi:hypothetical protein
MVRPKRRWVNIRLLTHARTSETARARASHSETPQHIPNPKVVVRAGLDAIAVRPPQPRLRPQPRRPQRRPNAMASRDDDEAGHTDPVLSGRACMFAHVCRMRPRVLLRGKQARVRRRRGRLRVVRSDSQRRRRADASFHGDAALGRAFAASANTNTNGPLPDVPVSYPRSVVCSSNTQWRTCTRLRWPGHNQPSRTYVGNRASSCP